MTACTDPTNRENVSFADGCQESTLATVVADTVQRYNSGDRAAMAELVRRVSPWLFHLCRGYRLSTPTAEDVVQNTLLVLFQHVQTLRDSQGALSWLTVVARREAIRAINTEKRTQPVDDMVVLDSTLDLDDPQHIFEAKALRRMVHRNLAKLPGRRRELLYLMFLAEVEGYATIGEILDMPVGSIGPTRQRGLDKLRDLLKSDAEWGPRKSA